MLQCKAGDDVIVNDIEAIVIDLLGDAYVVLYAKSEQANCQTVKQILFDKLDIPDNYFGNISVSDKIFFILKDFINYHTLTDKLKKAIIEPRFLVAKVDDIIKPIVNSNYSSKPQALDQLNTVELQNKKAQFLRMIESYTGNKEKQPVIDRIKTRLEAIQEILDKREQEADDNDGWYSGYMY